MPEMSSEFKQRVADKESWLASVADGEGGPAERTHLLATAALLHGVVEGIKVPDGVEERSRQRVMASCEELFRPPDAPTGRRSAWSHEPASLWRVLGGLLRVVFTLGRRR
jgi:hypothetical protein